LKKQLGDYSGGQVTTIKRKKIISRQIASESGIDPEFLESLRSKREEEIKAALEQKGILLEVYPYYMQ
jgi:hypothetical protein